MMRLTISFSGNCVKPIGMTCKRRIKIQVGMREAIAEAGPLPLQLKRKEAEVENNPEVTLGVLANVIHPKMEVKEEG